MSKPLASDFSAKADSYIGMSYSDLDCQALLEAMLRDVGIKKNWKGSNAMYRDMAWVGTPEECKKHFGCVPIGAFIYILKNDGKEPAEYRADGIGNADHVGIKVRTGKGSVHSSFTKGLVCESSFNDKTIPNGGWNRVGLCKLLDYGSEIEEILYGRTVSKDRSKNTDKLEMEVTINMITAIVQISSGVLNIRETPSSKGRDIGDIPNGASVRVLEKTSSEWWKVEYCGTTGYCAAEYLREVQNVTITLTQETAGALYQALSEALVD